MALFGKEGKPRRRKLSKQEKMNLKPQPLMVMLLKDGKKRMVNTGEFIKRS